MLAYRARSVTSAVATASHPLQSGTHRTPIPLSGLGVPKQTADRWTDEGPTQGHLVAMALLAAAAPVAVPEPPKANTASSSPDGAGGSVASDASEALLPSPVDSDDAGVDMPTRPEAGDRSRAGRFRWAIPKSVNSAQSPFQQSKQVAATAHTGGAVGHRLE